MRNPMFVLGLLAALAFGCAQTAEPTPETIPVGAKIFTLKLPGMT